MVARLLQFANVFGIGFVTYFLVGLAAALVEWSVFAVALTVMSPLFAACTGFGIATPVNWFLSRRFAFRSHRQYFEELTLVILVSLAVFVWNLAVFLGLYYFLAVPAITAKILGTLAGFLVNYGIRQFWVFSKIPRHQPVSVVVRQRKNENRRP